MLRPLIALGQVAAGRPLLTRLSLGLIPGVGRYVSELLPGHVHVRSDPWLCGYLLLYVCILAYVCVSCHISQHTSTCSRAINFLVWPRLCANDTGRLWHCQLWLPVQTTAWSPFLCLFHILLRFPGLFQPQLVGQHGMCLLLCYKSIMLLY